LQPHNIAGRHSVARYPLHYPVQDISGSPEQHPQHARAKNAQIEVVQGIDHLELIISDDGVGISDTARNKPLSFGLRGIHERVAYLGGTVKIASSANTGTQIAIFVPLEADDTTSTIPQQSL